MNFTKKSAVIIILLGIFMSTSVFGYDDSSEKRGRGGGHQGPPPEAYTACENKNEGDTAEFVSPRGDTVTGTCEYDRDGDQLVLRPDNPPEGGGRGERPMRGDRE